MPMRQTHKLGIPKLDLTKANQLAARSEDYELLFRAGLSNDSGRKTPQRLSSRNVTP
jgi:hypothetical protein